MFSINSIPETINKKDLTFRTVAEYWKLLFEEKKYYPTLEILTSDCPPIILQWYFVEFKFNTESYDREIDSYYDELEEKKKNAMFQQDVEEKFAEKIEACKIRRQKTILENPDMYFSCEIEKFEVKYPKDDVKYAWKLIIDQQTAIMMINSKSKFEKYDALFIVPTKDQKPTKITVSMK